MESLADSKLKVLSESNANLLTVSFAKKSQQRLGLIAMT